MFVKLVEARGEGLKALESVEVEVVIVAFFFGLLYFIGSYLLSLN